MILSIPFIWLRPMTLPVSAYYLTYAILCAVYSYAIMYSYAAAATVYFALYKQKWAHYYYYYYYYYYLLVVVVVVVVS